MIVPVGVTVAGRPFAYWPGNPLDMLIEWDPSDDAATYTWRLEAISGDVALPTHIWPATVVRVGQALTGAWTDVATAQWGPGTLWRLLRDDVTVIAGKMWRQLPQDDDDPLQAALVVELAGPPTLTVTVSPAGASTAQVAAAVAVETAARIADVDAEQARAVAAEDELAKRILVHDWSVSGWAPMTKWAMSQDGTQNFTLSVAARKGRFTPTTTDGNQRDWYVFPDTADWEDCEVEVLMWGPSALAAGNSPQLGVVVGAREVPGFPGEYQGGIAWTNVAFEFWDTLHVGYWESRAGVMYQGATQGSMTGNLGVARYPIIKTARRVDAFDVDQIICLQPHLYGLVNGDIVDVIGNDDTSFNRNGSTAAGVNTLNGFVQLSGATTAGSPVDAMGGGRIRPQAQHKRIFPQMLGIRRQAATNTLHVMRWLPEDHKPDWGDPSRVLTVTPTKHAAQNHQPNLGPGMIGIVAAHANTTGGAYGEYSRIRGWQR